MPQNGLKIVQLEAQNVKRLRAVRIRPDGSMVVIGGANSAGKTSVLDSIMYGLAGSRSICEEPIRKGARRGSVDIDLGEYTIRRTFSQHGGGTLTVKSNGVPISSPQKLLDDLAGKLSFDPLAFVRLDPSKQRKQLMALAGLDFSDLDAARGELYELRRSIGRDVKRLEAQQMDRFEDAPVETINVDEVSAELEKARQVEAEAIRAKSAVSQLKLEVDRHDNVVRGTADAIVRIEQQLGEAKAKHERSSGLYYEALERLRDAEAHAHAIQAPDMQPIIARMREAHELNDKIKHNQEADRRREELRRARVEHEQIQHKMEDLEEQRRCRLAAAKFPVEGLGFDDAGPTFNGLPLAQAGAAEQLRVSVGMGIALNPQLRIVLIRDGSLLDERSLRAIAQMAEEAGAQVWMERVGEGDEVSIVIEDGEVRE